MTHTSAEQPEALRLARWLEHRSMSGVQPNDLAASTELRRLYARVQELEAERDEAARRAPDAPVPLWDGKINAADFNVETFRRSGNGWLIKPDNGVRITHVPTGLFEEESSQRSTHTNKAVAWERLSARLEALAAAPQPPEASQAQRVPLSEGEIWDWWRSKNGLEDCDFFKYADFRKAVRAFEFKCGITQEKQR